MLQVLSSAMSCVLKGSKRKQGISSRSQRAGSDTLSEIGAMLITDGITVLDSVLVSLVRESVASPRRGP